MAPAHKGLEYASLPGNYQPVVAALPTPQPRNNLGQGQNGQVQNNQTIQPTNERPSDSNRRKSLSEIDGNPRPSASVGGQQEREKPRTILDLIFGG